jgi:ribosomal protein S18 acetylase RimI-like enzyme
MPIVKLAINIYATENPSRDIKIEEIESLYYVHKQIFGSVAYDFDFFKRLVMTSNYVILVYNDSNEIVGYLTACPNVNSINYDSDSSDSNSNSLESYLSNIGVLESYRKYGIATKMLQRYQKYADKKGIKLLSLDVFIGNNEAISFYIKNGFFIQGINSLSEDQYVLVKPKWNPDRLLKKKESKCLIS